MENILLNFNKNDLITLFEYYKVNTLNELKNKLLSKGNLPDNSSLFEAIRNNNKELVESLLTNDNVNLQDFHGITLLMYASRFNRTEILLLLLQQGADPNKSDFHGESALKIASEHGHTNLVKLLLQNGADPNITDYFGNTALMIASELGEIEIVKLLLNQEDIKINQQNKYGETALMIASERGHKDIVELITTHNILKYLKCLNELGHQTGANLPPEMIDKIIDQHDDCGKNLSREYKLRIRKWQHMDRKDCTKQEFLKYVYSNEYPICVTKSKHSRVIKELQDKKIV